MQQGEEGADLGKQETLQYALKRAEAMMRYPQTGKNWLVTANNEYIGVDRTAAYQFAATLQIS